MSPRSNYVAGRTRRLCHEFMRREKMDEARGRPLISQSEQVKNGEARQVGSVQK